MGPAAAETNGKSHDTEALYREHGAAVAALCRSLLRDRAEAEDAAQQVFLSAHRALLNGATPRDPLAWLRAVARYECYSRFHQRAAAPVPAAEAPDAPTADASVHALRAGELASVWDEVGQMPALQREAFLLREIRGLSYGQLADELSLSPPSVRSLLLRARMRLRQRLGSVVAGLGGAPGVQALLRLAAGADGASPLPAATKAAAVGVGALALVGGGGLVARHAASHSARPSARDHTGARGRRASRPAAEAVPRQVPPIPVVASATDHSIRPSNRSDGSESGRSSGDRQPRSGREGSDDATAAVQTTDGHDGGSSSSSGPGPGSSSDGASSGSSSEGGGTTTSGASSGSDGDSGSTTTLAGSSSSGSDGSGSSGPDGGSDSSHGSGGGSGSDGG
jgi:RNA polymerase sigma factor (sigma-70 family)